MMMRAMACHHLLIAAICSIPNIVSAQGPSLPELAAPVRLTAAGQPIDVPGFAAPAMADLDGDGRNDLLVGQLDNGRLRIYRNVARRGQPSFETYRWLESDRGICSVPTGCAVGFTPQVADLDGNGCLDILTGSFPGGAIFAFYGNPDGSFYDARLLVDRDGNAYLKEPRYNSTVFATDWDGDGDLDLVLGRGPASLVINDGDRSHARYGQAVPITVQGKPIPVGRVSPVVADWDGDGLDDLVTGRGGDVVWYRNTNATGPPQLDAARVLIAADSLGPAKDAGPDRLRTRPSQFCCAVCVTDFDADGDADLLLGDHYYLPREMTPQQRESYRSLNRQRSEFLRSYRELMDASSALSAEQRDVAFGDALLHWRRLAAEQFVGPQLSNSSNIHHGGIWLYRRN